MLDKDPAAGTRRRQRCLGSPCRNGIHRHRVVADRDALKSDRVTGHAAVRCLVDGPVRGQRDRPRAGHAIADQDVLAGSTSGNSETSTYGNAVE